MSWTQRNIKSCFVVVTFLFFFAGLLIMHYSRWNGYSNGLFRHLNLTSKFQLRIPLSPVVKQTSPSQIQNAKTISHSSKVDFPMYYQVDGKVTKQSILTYNASLHVSDKVSKHLDTPVKSSKLDENRKLWGCYHYFGHKLGSSRSRNQANFDVLSEMNCSRRAPSAILLGVKKCGSQTLTGFIDLHPDVVSMVFPPSAYSDSFILQDNDGFLKNIPLSTPNELTFIDMIEIQNDPLSLEHLITKLNSNDTKYLLILVNPVARAHSDFVHVKVKMKLQENSKLVKHKMMNVWGERRKEPNIFFKGYRIAQTFEKSVRNSSGSVDMDNNLIKKGIYYTYVKTILKYVSGDQLLIVDGEQFISEPWMVLNQVEKFLGINPYFKESLFAKKGKFYCPVTIERSDADCLKGKGRKKKTINEKMQRMLKRFYQPYNLRLENLIRKRLSWM